MHTVCLQRVDHSFRDIGRMARAAHVRRADAATLDDLGHRVADDVGVVLRDERCDCRDDARRGRDGEA